MFNAAAHYEIKTPRREVKHLYNRVVLGASGAVSSQDSEGDAGFVVTKTAAKTGRYTVTLSGGRAAKLLKAHITVVGADDSAYTGTAGHACIVRDIDVSTDGTFELQLLKTDTLADAEAINSATLLVEVVVQLV